MKKILIQIDPEVHRALNVYAAQHDTRLYPLIPKILEAFVKANPPEEGKVEIQKPKTAKSATRAGAMVEYWASDRSENQRKAVSDAGKRRAHANNPIYLDDEFDDTEFPV